MLWVGVLLLLLQLLATSASASAASSSSSECGSPHTALLDWATQQQQPHEEIIPMDSAGRSTQQLANDQVVLVLPRAAYLAVEEDVIQTGYASQLKKLLAARLNNNTLLLEPSNTEEDEFAKFTLEHVALTLQLMHEKDLGPRSTFHAYIQSLLPQVGSRGLELVHTYSDAELARFQHAALISKAKEMAHRVRAIFSILFPGDEEDGDEEHSSRYADFVWADAIVRQRAFKLPSGEGEEDTVGELVLLPLLDGLRVSVLDQNCEIDLSLLNATLRITAPQGVPAGAQLVAAPRAGFSSLYLVLHHGTVHNNADDADEVNVFEGYLPQLPRLTTTAQQPGGGALQMLAKVKIAKLAENSVRPVVRAVAPPLDLVAFFRVAMMSDAKDVVRLGNDLALGPAGGPALEEVALAACVKQLDQELAHFTPATPATSNGGEDNDTRAALAAAYVGIQRRLLERGRTYCSELLSVARDFPDDDEAYFAQFAQEMSAAIARVTKQVYE